METETVADIALFPLEPTDIADRRWERWAHRFVVAKNNRRKAMLLHFAGEAAFELSDVVGVTENDNFAETKRKLTEYFRPQCNKEYESSNSDRQNRCLQRLCTSIMHDRSDWRNIAIAMRKTGK